MKFITLDLETYYDKKCSIKKLGTSLYVQHPDFEVMTMSWKTLDMAEPEFIVGDDIRRFFDDLQPYASEVILNGHHMQFDGYAISHCFGFLPGRYTCTMAMAKPLWGQHGSTSLQSVAGYYGLDGKVSGVLEGWEGLRWDDATPEQQADMRRYNNQDTALTEQLFLLMARGFPRFEFDVIDLTIRMFTDPAIIIDKEGARRIIDEEKEIKDAALAEIFSDKKIDQVRTMVRSNPQFAKLLELLDVEVPMKVSPTTGKDTFAFAKNDLPFQRLMKHEDPRVRSLMDARITNKTSINETRAKKMIVKSGHPLPIYLGYCGAHTFRFTGGDQFNPQNLPRDGRLRSCLTAPKGHTFVVIDASQIEARDNAVFSEQWDLVDEFAAGVDVYSSFASELYGFEVNADDNWQERFVGKTGILGLGYQCGAFKFQSMLETGAMGPAVHLNMDEAERIVQMYRAKYYKIKDTWSQLQSLIQYMMPDARHEIEFRGLVIQPGGKVLMPNGLTMQYPDLQLEIGEYGTAEFTYRAYHPRYRKAVTKKLYGGAWLENIIQSRCRTITTGHALEMSRFYKVVLLVHDEVIMCVPNHQAEQCLRDATEIMSIPPDWNPKIPLASEGKITERYIK